VIVSRMEEIKYGKKFDWWLSHTKKVEREIKQVFSIYYGQCNEHIKSSLTKDPTFNQVNEDKNLIALDKLLQSINFSYKPS
jgi:hypothetical protein